MSKKDMIHKKQHSSATQAINEKSLPRKRRPYFSLLPIIPNLVIIAICIGIYYAMVNFYLFFNWGFFIYYGLKFLIGYQILAAAIRSIIVPLGSVIIGVTSILLANNAYVTNLISPETAWQLTIVGLIGLLICVLVRI
ncbi:MAG TPA: hypothetical protein VHA13_02165 [Gammaproteobacteria bacterium]|nr:hypothetical protein [Gammaproteobacteria bacterium]